MTDNILNIPSPTKEPGQRSLSVSEAYFTRFIPSWTFPSGMSAEAWRIWARRQPVASDCKDILISSIQALDWKISPRDSEMRDELKGTVRHYTRLFEKGGEWLGLDWTGLLEWLLNDLQDLPFGAAAEVGRKNDSPEGRVMWLKPLDAGTLYPTLNKKFPVMQYYGSAVQIVKFPEHAIARMYMNPRPEIEREGWGMAPPERVYLALEMLSRGDSYYANLLLDVPPAGILDLGDMEKDTALEWINSFRTFVANGGIDGFKVPVLYEHTTKPQFIPFGKVPNEIMYDKITLKYAALVTAAYGMTLNDIGLQASSGGETLAGGIRSEKKTRKTGFARAKKKLKYFFETILPDTLQFDFVDMDDELATALGRARLANATAWGQLIERGVFDRKEARLQTLQDGLVTISVPEEPPSNDDWAEQKQKRAMDLKMAQGPVGPAGSKNSKPAERPGMLGNPQPPSAGGDGEVKKSAFTFLEARMDAFINRSIDAFVPVVRSHLLSVPEDEMEITRSSVINTVFSDDDSLGINLMIRRIANFDQFCKFSLSGFEKEIVDFLSDEGLYPVGVERRLSALEEKCDTEFPAFLGKAIFHTILNSDKIFGDDIVQDVKEKIEKSIYEYVSSFIQIELSQMVDDIRKNSIEVPQSVRVPSMVRKSVGNITVEAPQISLPSINVSVPERSLTVEPPVVNLGDTNVDVSVPKQDAPVVNFIPPAQDPPVVNLSVPEQTINVESPVVQLSVPAQELPKIVIENQVNPTPVTVKNNVEVKPADVNMPKARREIQNVHRDINGNIDGTITDIEYEE